MKLDQFIASLPSRETTELLAFIANESNELGHQLIGEHENTDFESTYRKALSAVRAEVNTRIPKRAP